MTEYYAAIEKTKLASRLGGSPKKDPVGEKNKMQKTVYNMILFL